MQQIRKPMPTARQTMTAAKSARSRPSAERKLIELKWRLREISDLTAAGDVLNWDQTTYMPREGADALGRQCAVLYRLAHEQAVAPALGRLLDALAHYGESHPAPSDPLQFPWSLPEGLCLKECIPAGRKPPRVPRTLATTVPRRSATCRWHHKFGAPGVGAPVSFDEEEVIAALHALLQRACLGRAAALILPGARRRCCAGAHP
jgi:hypothetical protein